MFEGSILKAVVSVVLSVFTVLSFTLGSTAGFTSGDPIVAERRNYVYQNKPLLIGGYNFNPANANRTQVEYVADCDIDFLITSVNEPLLNLCDEYNIGVIAKSYNASAMYYKTYGNTSWFNISPQTYKDHPCLWGDDLIDEPTSEEFETLSAMVNHYYANTTGKIPLINLFPIYANSEQLGNSAEIPILRRVLLLNSHDSTDDHVDRYKRHVSDYINTIDTDYISVDIYPLEQGKTASGQVVIKTNPRWLRNLDILAEACRATNRDLWVITQAAGNTVGENGSMRYCDTPEDIRWQAYVSLCFGTKAIIHACYNSGWWDTDSHLIDATGNRTDTYYAAQTVNRELKAIAEIYGEYTNQGAFLVNGFSAAGTQGGYLLPINDAYKPEVKSKSPLLIGCFTKESTEEQAFTVVNMIEPEKNKSACAQLCFDKERDITVYRNGIPSTVRSKTLTIELESREGVFVTVK